MRNSSLVGLFFLTCLAFIDAASAAQKPKHAQKYVKNKQVSGNDKKNAKPKDAGKNADSMQQTVAGQRLDGNEKIIEVNSVNFIKLKNKPQEIFIPNPEVADVDMLNDSSLYLMGLAPGVTPLVVHGKDGVVIADYRIKVTYPIKAIKEAMDKMYPGIEVSIVSVDDSIILRGKVPSPEVASDVQDIVGRFVESAKIINKLSIETATQVMLKVKIAEVSRNLTKSLGINWRVLSHNKDISGLTYGFMHGDSQAFPVFATEISAVQTAITEQGGIMGKTLSGGRWLVHGGGASNGLSGLIEALASESFALVLAEPTLIALSGKTATFKSGGEQGYEVKQSGTDSNTTEFKSWGTSIEFTPVVISEDRINITVKPVVSTVSFENAKSNIPSLTTKEAETTVELGSGQSLAIAGLIQTNKSTSSYETPFLSDLPLVGSLFRNSDINLVEKELIIIITPYIIKPSSKPLKTPVDLVPRMYSPLESILTRKFHKNVKRRHSAGFMIR
ncbi:MAG: pilus assembly protein N-terminal domain-containing protein [Holosporaceae bacterium]|jgi:pilus assembly protein CpaC|nr:pilus assembly protein N-terminal domain-containing protein [Holosporaceae bacterium]